MLSKSCVSGHARSALIPSEVQLAHALYTTVEDFIHGLTSFERDIIAKDAIRQYCDSMRLPAEALKPFSFFRDDTYTRNLVYRDDLFEVMVICWKPGQKTTVHTHNGQLGWMDMPQGEVSIHNFHYLSCNAPENQNVVGMDCLGGATEIDLERVNTMAAYEHGPIYTVDKLHTIHQIECAETAKAGAMSLHIYSLPIDSCVAFDLEHQRCYRRSLAYYSRNGTIETEPLEPAPRSYSLPILKQ
jgi:cysteine dioxygenase